MMAFVTTNKSLMLKIKQQRAIRRLISFKKVPPGQNPCRSSTLYSASTGEAEEQKMPSVFSGAHGTLSQKISVARVRLAEHFEKCLQQAMSPIVQVFGCRQ
jgi:hypothetical protein